MVKLWTRWPAMLAEQFLRARPLPGSAADWWDVINLDAAVRVDIRRWAMLRSVSIDQARSDLRRHAIEVLASDPVLRRAGAELDWWC